MSETTIVRQAEIEGYDLNLYYDGEWVIWLEPEEGIYHGVCLGTGETPGAAIASAKEVLAGALKNIDRLA